MNIPSMKKGDAAVIARFFVIVCLMLATASAHAWFFIFPIPNLAKPAALQTIIDALEKSDQTRALAYVSEDKAFGSRMWLWGKHSGFVSQEEANDQAINECRRNLTTARAKMEGGQLLYNFGNKDCELYSFSPNDGPKKAEEIRRATEESKRRELELETAKKIAADEERKRIAAEDEQKRADEEQRKRVAEDEQRKQAADAEERRLMEAQLSKPGMKEKTKSQQKPGANTPPAVAQSTKGQGVDFNFEASKAARILGCQPLDNKVTGIDAGSILYSVRCSDGKAIELACDQTGLCLRR